MEKKEFKKTIKDCFIDYGFEYYNKKFYLNLSNIVIRVQYFGYPYSKGFTIEYDIIVKALCNQDSMHSIDKIAEEFDDDTEIQMGILNCFYIDGIARKGFVFNNDEWTKDDLQQRLHNALIARFDSFKDNDLLEFKKRVNAKNDNNYIILVSKKVEDYLNNVSQVPPAKPVVLDFSLVFFLGKYSCGVVINLYHYATIISKIFCKKS